MKKTSNVQRPTSNVQWKRTILYPLFSILRLPPSAFVSLLCALCVLLLSSSCSTTATTWQKNLAPDTLANQTVVSVAKHYGGQNAAELASAGLSATAEVLQGYVDKKPPLDIVVESPGVEGVGHILINFLKKKGIVTQATVDNIHKAAAFATRLTYTADNKTADNKKN